MQNKKSATSLSYKPNCIAEETYKFSVSKEMERNEL